MPGVCQPSKTRRFHQSSAKLGYVVSLPETMVYKPKPIPPNCPSKTLDLAIGVRVPASQFNQGNNKRAALFKSRPFCVPIVCRLQNSSLRRISWIAFSKGTSTVCHKVESINSTLEHFCRITKGGYCSFHPSGGLRTPLHEVCYVSCVGAGEALSGGLLAP